MSTVSVQYNTTGIMIHKNHPYMVHRNIKEMASAHDRQGKASKE